jgi:Transposase zinc-binding domain
MSRPALELADIFRGHGPAWRHANAGRVSLDQLKVMSAIEDCRTAALGGHVLRCENDKCGHTQIAYNSCLMGKFRNGELAAFLSAAKPKTDAVAPHYGFALSRAMSLSGGRKDPLRRCGGTTASMASSFSVGSPRV